MSKIDRVCAWIGEVPLQAQSLVLFILDLEKLSFAHLLLLNIIRLSYHFLDLKTIQVLNIFLLRVCSTTLQLKFPANPSISINLALSDRDS